MTLGQAVNLSQGGMLVRGFHHYALGARLVFDLRLPAPVQGHVRGRARIARNARADRDGVTGLALVFTGLGRADEARLRSYVEYRIG